MTKDAALIIVDMQPCFAKPISFGRFFKDHYKEVTNNVKILIKDAARNKIPVILVEFEGCGKTLLEIRRLLYKNKHSVVIKNQNDGSDAVIRACTKLKIKPTHFVICGLYYSACIKATANGLSKKAPQSKITIIKDACNGEDPEWKSIPKNIRMKTLFQKTTI